MMAGLRVLPPHVIGNARCLLEITFKELLIECNLFFPETAGSLVVQLQWWGEASPCHLRPTVIKYMGTSVVNTAHKKECCIMYEIQTVPELFCSYLSCCEPLEFCVMNVLNQDIIGSGCLRHLNDIVLNSQFTVIPIVDYYGNSIGELRIQFVYNKLEDCGSKEVKKTGAGDVDNKFNFQVFSPMYNLSYSNVKHHNSFASPFFQDSSHMSVFKQFNPSMDGKTKNTKDLKPKTIVVKTSPVQSSTHSIHSIINVKSKSPIRIKFTDAQTSTNSGRKANLIGMFPSSAPKAREPKISPIRTVFVDSDANANSDDMFRASAVEMDFGRNAAVKPKKCTTIINDNLRSTGSMTNSLNTRIGAAKPQTNITNGELESKVKDAQTNTDFEMITPRLLGVPKQREMKTCLARDATVLSKNLLSILNTEKKSPRKSNLKNSEAVVRSVNTRKTIEPIVISPQKISAQYKNSHTNHLSNPKNKSPIKDYETGVGLLGRKKDLKRSEGELDWRECQKFPPVSPRVYPLDLRGVADTDRSEETPPKLITNNTIRYDFSNPVEKSYYQMFFSDKRMKVPKGPVARKSEDDFDLVEVLNKPENKFFMDKVNQEGPTMPNDAKKPCDRCKYFKKFEELDQIIDSLKGFEKRMLMIEKERALSSYRPVDSPPLNDTSPEDYSSDLYEEASII